MTTIADVRFVVAGCVAVGRRERRSLLRERLAGTLVGVAALCMFQPGLALGQGCVGDCDGSESVTVDELVTGVNIALGNLPLGQCSPFDGSGNGQVTVDELVGAVNMALNGCPRGQITFDRLALAVFQGGRDTLSVTAEDDNSNPVGWSVVSSDPSVASVSKTGSGIDVAGVSLGIAEIVVTAQTGLRRSVPVRVYDPTVLDVGGVLVDYVDLFECIPGGPAHDEESFYRPLVADGWYALGSFRFGQRDCPNIDRQQWMVAVTENPATSFDERDAGDLPGNPPRAVELAAGDNRVRGSVGGEDPSDSFSFTLTPGGRLNGVFLSHFAGTWGEVRFFAGTDPTAPPPAFLGEALVNADNLGADYLDLLGLDLPPGVYTISIAASAPQRYEVVLNIGANPAAPPLVDPKYFQAQVGHFGWLLWAPVCPAGYVAMGTVVTTNLGDDTPPPDASEGACVRKDLSVNGAPLPPSDGFSTARITAPDNSQYQDTTAYLEAGTMSVVFPTGQTDPHPVSNVLAVDLPMLVDAANPTWFPSLTGFREPPLLSEPVMEKALLVPFSILDGEAYRGKGVGWMVANSPFVRVERVRRWERLFYNYNQSGAVQNHERTFTKGMSTEQSTSISRTTGMSLTVESGVRFLGFGGKVSATVSYQLGYESQHRVGEFEEAGTTVGITVLPGTAAAAWRAQSSILVKLHDPSGGEIEELVRLDMADSLTTVNDDFPD